MTFPSLRSVGVTALAVAVSFVLGHQQGHSQGYGSDEAHDETLNMMMQCADDLVASERHCTAEGEAAMQRAVQIWQCEKTVCEANGWMPPMDQDLDGCLGCGYEAEMKHRSKGQK